MGCGASSKSTKYEAVDASKTEPVPPPANVNTHVASAEKPKKKVKVSEHSDTSEATLQKVASISSLPSKAVSVESGWDVEAIQATRSDVRPTEIHETVDEIPESYRASDRVLSHRRVALSAEAFGEYNRWQEFEMPEVESKTPEQAERIKEAMFKSPILRPLASRQQEFELAISAFKSVTVGKGEEVITQGTDGTDLFLLESGILDVFVRMSPEEKHPGTKVATFDQPGKEFGELALLHNCPRAATIVAQELSTLWSIGRKSFNIIMRDRSKARHDRHMGFLRSVKLLDPLNTPQLAQISDAVSTVQYKKGDFVVKEGEIGDCFYMVEEGEAMARINGMDVRSYKRGGYFGELSLINDRPRAADIVAASEELHLVSLDRESFTRLLGDKALFNRASVKQATSYAPTSGERRKSVTFASSDSMDGLGPEEGKPKFRMRNTGFVSANKLIDLLADAGVDIDEDEEDEDEQSNSRKASMQSTLSSDVVQTKAKKVGFNAAPGEGAPAPKLRKQGTGFIDASALKALLAECEDEDEDEEEEEEPKVRFADQSVDSKRGSLDSSQKKPVKVKRGTGYISTEQLKKLIASQAEEEDEDDEEEEAEPETKKVQFDAGAADSTPKGPKRGTGFVHVNLLQKLIDEEDFEEEDDEPEQGHHGYRYSVESFVDPKQIASLVEDEELEEKK